MSEWWTYTLRDFLLFSPRTYYRLFEIYNAAIWPAQIVGLALGVAIWILRRRSSLGRARVIAAILAGCWLFVAIAFQAHRYAMINTAGVYFAWAFGLEAGLLIAIGVLGGRLAFERPEDLASRAGLAIFLFALAGEPSIGLLLRGSWRQIEIFGVAPDPTAVATLGLLLAASGRGRWALFLVPTVWCAVTGATLLAMKAPDFWIPPLAAVLALVLAVWQTRLRRRIRATSATPVST